MALFGPELDVINVLHAEAGVPVYSMSSFKGPHQ